MSQKYCITVLRNISQYCIFTWKTNPIHSEKWNTSYLKQGACDFLITKKISRDFDEFFENHYILEELVSRITNIKGGLPKKRGLGQFVNLRVGLARKRWGWCFWGGVNTPMHTMTIGTFVIKELCFICCLLLFNYVFSEVSQWSQSSYK